MTDFAAAWAIRKPSDEVLDPGCGDGAFLVSAANRLRMLDAEDIGSRLWGIDINQDAVATASRELAFVDVEQATIQAGNFFAFDALGLFQIGRRADALVGNPPYIRYQLFREENRTSGLRAAARAGVLLPRLASSWAPYLIHATTFLRDGGRMAMVLPAELLHVGYASAVRTFLLQHFADLTVISFEDKVFPGALEEVVIVLGTKGKGHGRLRVRRLPNLADLAAGPDAILAKATSCEVQPGQRWVAALFEGDLVTQAIDVIDGARFHKLGDFGRVDIGVVTGANDFFIVSKQDIAKHRLPFSILLPAVSKAIHIQGSRFTINDWSSIAESGADSYLLVIDEASAVGPVLRYIQEGERIALHRRYKCRVRDPWYQVPYVRKPDLFLTYMSHISPRLVVNEAGATHSNTLHGIFLSDPLLSDPLAAAFLNSATLLSAEIEGRSYGGGVLKTEPGEAVRIRLPHLTPRLVGQLTEVLPKIDELVRQGRIDEASVVVDRIVLRKHFRVSEIEQIRAALSALRSRRLLRGKKGR
jgi:adenine-specific DNA methylase